VELWTAQHAGETKVDAIDRRLHAERLDDARRGRRTHRASYAELPDGAMVVVEQQAWLVAGSELLRWSLGGYTDRVSRPDGVAEVLTPPSLVTVLAAGWSGDVPLLHPHRAGVVTG
jgi:hypothetical protein